MTIRQYLKRRTRLFLAMAIGSWLLCALPIGLFGGSGQLQPGRGDIPPTVAFFLGFPIFAGAIIGMMFFVKCPRCSARLGQFTMQTPFSTGRQMNFCPYCGVNLDEPYQKL
jgi:hypothetical protein